MQAQTLDDGLQYVPAAAAVGLDFCGVEACHELRERIALTATAYAAMTAVTGGLKLTVSEQRPDGSDCHSFPSGHAARAFMGAELVRSEYGWQWGVGAYAFATGVAALRVAGDHHYLHDVAAGAAIGVLSARFAYWLLPYERRLFPPTTTPLGPLVSPSLPPCLDSKSFLVISGGRLRGWCISRPPSRRSVGRESIWAWH